MKEIVERYYESKNGFVVKPVLTTDYFELPTWDELRPVLRHHCWSEELGAVEAKRLASQIPYSLVPGTTKRLKIFSVVRIPGSKNEDFHEELIEFMAREGAMFPNYAPQIAMMKCSDEIFSIETPGTIYGIDETKSLYFSSKKSRNEKYTEYYVSAINLCWKCVATQKWSYTNSPSKENIPESYYREIGPQLDETMEPAIERVITPKIYLRMTHYPSWGNVKIGGIELKNYFMFVCD